LADVVETNGPLPPSSVAVLAHRLAEALAALHADGLVHRDLKPSNVILTADGPYVIDFGIAQTVDDEPDLTGVGEPVAGSLRQCFTKHPAARPAAHELASRSATWPAVVDGSGWPPPGIEDRPTGGSTVTGPAAALLEPPGKGGADS
jgi:hypothetical protein